MHKHRQSIRGKVKKVFVVKDNKVSYYNIKLNKHIVANYVSERHVDMFVDGYNKMVDEKQNKSKRVGSRQFGFEIV
jgi:hypothetical protein